MVNQDLLTIFIALAAMAVLLQTGIMVGFYLLSTKLSRQADQAMDATRNLLGPIQNTVESLQAASARIAEFGAITHAQVRQFENWWRRHPV